MARIEHEAGRGLQVLVDLGGVADLSDGELLERFVARREEAVFAVLVGRLGPMVWGVCRRILRDHHDAEDAFQAAFLVLAQRAGSVAPRDRVGPWLHGVAHRTALKARGLQARRRAREIPGSTPPDAAAAPPEPPDDRLALLDREVARLPARYRDPIVLCELEGKSYRAAADQLGWPVGTVSGRLTRARAILAERIGRGDRGDRAVPLVVAPRLAPGHLAGPIARVAPLVAAGVEVAAGVVSAGSITLMRGVLTTMLLSRIKLAALAVATSTLTLGAGGLAYRATCAAPPPPPPEQRPAAPPPAIQTPTAKSADPMASYAYSIEADPVYHGQVAIDYGKVRLRGERVSILPMTTTQGIAGAMLVGELEFAYTPEPGQEFKGRASGAMLRFNPGQSAAFLKPEGQLKMRNQGMAEMGRQLLRSAVNRCWHRGQEVLLPPRGAFAAVVYAEESGELLISFDEKTATVHDFTARKGLYDRK